MPILEWLNKKEAIKGADKASYRLLKANPELSYGQQSENMIIKGDNLEALKALLPYYKGQVKCIYIDPPYNTKKAFNTYDDNIEHSIWLSLMCSRIELLWELLKSDGVLLISINDDEAHYLKVLCDEICGRSNFITSLIWHYEGNTDNQAKIINYHEYILVYSRNGKLPDLKVIDPGIKSKSKLFKEEIRNTVIKNGPKNPASEITIPSGFPASFKEGIIEVQNVNYPKYNHDIIVKNWKVTNQVIAKSGWSSKNILQSFIDNKFKSVQDSKKQETTFEIKETGAIEYIKKRAADKGHFVSVLRGFGTTNQMRLYLKELGLAFEYPKPVNLIAYLINAFSEEQDIILDSFLGSGTTAEVAHKMRRKYIGIEMGEHAITHCIPRLKSVIDGEPGVGLESISWQGGGGYTYYDLDETVFDEEGNINPDIDFKTLASHIWFSETKTALNNFKKSPLIGVHNDVAYYLLYNGILGDKKVDGGNVLTSKILESLPPYDGKKIIYGEASRFKPERLKKENIIFKQTPYDVKEG